MDDAEARVCRQFEPRIRVFARRRMRDPSAAEDFTQEILITVIEALRAGRVEQPERMGAYVLGICRMTLRDARRNARRREGLFEQYKGDLAPDPGEPAGGRSLDAARLQQCMGKLAEKDRAVLVLTFYADKDAAEIAASLGLTSANVRVVRHRALARLHACVKGAGGEAP
ncbi:MAG: RNA polymerase sigma factor [Polyangiaceae bacterium]